MNEKQLNKLKQIYNSDISYGYFEFDIIENIDEAILSMNTNMLGLEVSFIGEIDELLERKSKDEIFELIVNCDLSSLELNEDEIYFLKKKLVKLLNIRFNLKEQDVKKLQYKNKDF